MDAPSDHVPSPDPVPESPVGKSIPTLNYCDIRPAYSSPLLVAAMYYLGCMFGQIGLFLVSSLDLFWIDHARDILLPTVVAMAIILLVSSLILLAMLGLVRHFLGRVPIPFAKRWAFVIALFAFCSWTMFLLTFVTGVHSISPIVDLVLLLLPYILFPILTAWLVTHREPSLIA